MNIESLISILLQVALAILVIAIWLDSRASKHERDRKESTFKEKAIRVFDLYENALEKVQAELGDSVVSMSEAMDEAERLRKELFETSKE